MCYSVPEAVSVDLAVCYAAYACSRMVDKINIQKGMLTLDSETVWDLALTLAKNGKLAL